MRTDLTTAYLRWTFIRAALARGYWTTTAVYLVVVAHLTPFQLVAIGTFQGFTMLVAEVPAGVLADTVSRRRALVIAQVVTGSGMVMAGLVTAFPLLVVSQCLWGLGWAFSSGADVAWITDELDRPDRIDRVLATQARRELVGNAAGIVCIGALAWATTLSTGIVAAGIAMVLLSVAVARWPETNFAPVDAGRRWRESIVVLRTGFALARLDHVIRVVLIAVLLENGSLDAYGRLVQHQLIELGFPTQPDPIVWFALLGLTGVALGAAVLRIVEARIDGNGVAPRTYALACGIGVLGLLLFAHAPNVATAVAGALLVSGIARPIARVAGVIMVNRRTTSAVRATVHSFLAQAEYLGELLLTLPLAVLAGATSSTVALTAAAACVAVAGAMVGALREHPAATAPSP